MGKEGTQGRAGAVVVVLALALLPRARHNLMLQRCRRCAQDNMKACNNACWSLGELCLKLQPGLVTECAQVRCPAQPARGARQRPGW